MLLARGYDPLTPAYLWGRALDAVIQCQTTTRVQLVPSGAACIKALPSSISTFSPTASLVHQPRRRVKRTRFKNIVLPETRLWGSWACPPTSTSTLNFPQCWSLESQQTSESITISQAPLRHSLVATRVPPAPLHRQQRLPARSLFREGSPLHVNMPFLHNHSPIHECVWHMHTCVQWGGGACCHLHTCCKAQ